MLQLKNNTPFAAAVSLFPNEQGIDTLYTLVKATFNIGPQWTLADEQLEPQKEDVFWGEPGKSSLRFASDIHTGKAATDIIMTGMACTPQQQLVRQMDVSLSVGSLSKTVRVIGDRHWDQGRISTAEAFATMPLTYERAFGGTQLLEDKVLAMEGRNPVGRGFVGKRKESEMNGSLLPNLESPQQLIQYCEDTPAPQGFAAIAPNWQPRVQYAGTYDQQWQRQRAPYLPQDYSPKFMNAAHPDLIYPGFLKGGEPVRIVGMHASGELQFNLPLVNLSGKVSLKGSDNPLAFVLETVHLDPNQMQLSLLWRAPFICDKKALNIEQITLGLQR